ncbi:LOW QUALITY PROTEIN: serine/threonine-protein kinase-like protein CCR1 [Curcuma longa]|uniref:LOW QUALITY PROTEIN: serine/threonine-protein kinase-like protein CCR1 n=1 Tax=Curcuma longa TaxID=136217 RepID=UPI003D9ECACA
MTPKDRSAIGVAIALLCLALVALMAVLYVLCRNKFAAVDPEAGDGEVSTSAPILPAAHFHQLSDVEIATAGFHGSRVVGCGRLGTVYKATEADGGRAYSVKRIHHHLVLGNPGMSFSSRMKSLSYRTCHRPNVVPVLGFSEAPGERLIISEFLGESSCSLEHYLKQGSAVLGWAARLRIRSSNREM